MCSLRGDDVQLTAHIRAAATRHPDRGSASGIAPKDTHPRRAQAEGLLVQGDALAFLAQPPQALIARRNQVAHSHSSAAEPLRAQKRCAAPRSSLEQHRSQVWCSWEKGLPTRTNTQNAR